METIKEVQKMKVQNFTVPAGSLKVVKMFVKDHRGRKVLLKGFCDKSTKRIMVLVDDNFARYKGHLNRIDLLTKYEQLHNSGNILLNDPSTGAFLTISYNPSTRQYLN